MGHWTVGGPRSPCAITSIVLVVVNLVDEHPAWSLPKELFAKLTEDFREVDFHWNRRREDYFRQVNRAEVIWSWSISPDIFALAQELKWFHAQAVGMRHTLFPQLVKSRVIVTNASGVSATAIAEHGLAMVLALTRQLPAMLEYQRKHHFAQREIWDLWEECGELSSRTFGLVGFGSVGRELARLLRAFSARVLAYRRRRRGSRLAERVFIGDEIDAMLAQCDFIVSSLPGTEETHHFFDDARFRAMKRGAYFVNLGRGWTVGEAALLRALGWNERTGKWESGWLAGAALDVFAEEPLPASSPLWDAPRIIISPHVAALSPNFWPRSVELFACNLRHYLAGEKLENRVSLRAGY